MPHRHLNASQVECIVTDLRRLYLERNAALERAERAQLEALLHMALAAGCQEDGNGASIVRIGLLSEALALTLGWSPVEAARLRCAAPMHDVGTLGVPEQVRRKAADLTSEERALMHRHPQIGAQLIGPSSLPLFEMAAAVALLHHERWDGLGYPRRLAAEEIPPAARIVAVVDFFDTLTTGHDGGPALPVAAALDLLDRERGNAFDPRVVAAFFENRQALLALLERIDRAAPAPAVLLDAQRCGELLGALRADSRGPMT